MSLANMRTSLLLCLYAPLFASAQKPRLAPPPVAGYGTVSGTVICLDNNLPARLASVTLEPVKEHVATREAEPHAPEASYETFQTRLDGSFSMPHVMAGRYYVVVQKPGYLSPAGLFTKAEIDWPANPADDVSDAVERMIPVVTVAANRGSSVDVRLTRAAAISGALRYDDGTPVSTQFITVQRKGPKDTWLSTNLGGRRGNGMTDDLGRFRIAGVPAGEYRLSTTLDLSRVTSTTLFSTNSSSSGTTLASIRVYLGDTFRKKDARLLKIDDGQEVTADLTIPNSKLHTVSGSLVDARSGQIINAGTIRLSFANDQDVTLSAAVDQEEPLFLLPFVPDGTYTVRVNDARDVTRTPAILPEGTVSTEHYKEIVTKTFAPYEGTLVVKSDLTGVVLQIPVKDQALR